MQIVNGKAQFPELTEDEYDHARLIAMNMKIDWLLEQLTLELFDANMSKQAAQLLLALNIKARQS